ncbi:Eukaryotic translation initiation factor 3 subunit M {ECO:0000256/HAMAP-Rule:MF_03012} Short=eIF3m {ECO:0000256/HAMAP-Rule:MF_03012} [Serendipita indica DSM 11827]|nr:Eukaryotic translation initiation factor 3 subunit M {ECO:0000256/HAMAP-Rule:MF_03012} Short=eIF3m {ECO:0000256/HAMAP-Rule:MF_03012} [Serendipita indica DSM 11827]
MSGRTGDLIALYSEGTFDEHIQELADYLARPLSEEERAAFVKPFVTALLPDESKKTFEEDAGRRKAVLDLVVGRVSGLGEGTDKEVEGFFNLLVAHVLDSYPDPSAPLSSLTKSICSAHRSSTIKYRLLSNIFNALPHSSPLRPRTFSELLKLASDNEELDVLHLHKAEVDKWLEEWEIDTEERAQFCKDIADALVKASQPVKAYPYLILRAQLLPSNSPNATKAIVEAITDGLRLASVFSFEPILALPNITMVRDHPLFKLVKVFLRGGLAEWKAWLESHEAELSTAGLDKNAVERKVRLVSLTALASNNIGKEISYAEIARALDVGESEVESWVIQGMCFYFCLILKAKSSILAIRAKLVLGKLNQPAQTFVVIRSTTRQFTPGDWEVLEDKLEKWKEAILGVLSVVSAARKKSAGAGAAGGPQVNGVQPVAA